MNMRAGWSKGAWFGSTVGGTLYVYLSAVEIFVETGSVLYGCLVLATASTAAGLCVFLWTLRESLDPASAMQLLIWICGLCGVGTFAMRDLAGVGTYPLTDVWWAFLLFPALSVFFRFRLVTRPVGPATLLRTFGSSDTPLTKDGINSDGDGWRIESAESRTVLLFEVVDPGAENCMVIYRADIRTADVTGRAYLEMWCRLPGRGEFFSRGFHNAVKGTIDWTTCEIPFYLKKGHRPDLIKLNLVLEGSGTVWIKEVELLRASSR